MPYVPTTAWYAMVCKREREKMFEEKCQRCRESIIQKYHDDTLDDSDYCRRYCVRHKKFVKDYETCEDWMPKNNV